MIPPGPWDGTILALCCQCAAVREVSRQAMTNSGNRLLKCSTCGERSMHAMVHGRDGYGDWRAVANVTRENHDRRYDKAGTQPPLPSVHGR